MRHSILNAQPPDGPVDRPVYHEPWPPAPGGYAQPEPPARPPRKRRRVFPWVFMAIQAIFLIWLITGAASGGSIHSGAVAYCHAHPSPYVPFSQCVTDYGGGSKMGAAIGLGVIILLWALADIILGICYGVYRLARRG